MTLEIPSHNFTSQIIVHSCNSNRNYAWKISCIFVRCVVIGMHVHDID